MIVNIAGTRHRTTIIPHDIIRDHQLHQIEEVTTTTTHGIKRKENDLKS
jgi:hypothetical protein